MVKKSPTGPSIHSDSLNAEYARHTPPTPPAAPYGTDGRGEIPKSYDADGRRASVGKTERPR